MNFAKSLHRYIIGNRIKNRLLPNALEETVNKCTHQLVYDLGKSRKCAAAMWEKNIVIGLQTLLTFRRPFSSTVDKANGSEMIVRHDPDERKFYVGVVGVGSAYIEYEKKDDLIILKHTLVPNELGGRGIGKILAKEALEYVAKNDLQLEIKCSFIRKYVSKHEPKYIKYIKK